MGKRPNEQNGQRPNSTLRVLFVELNGSDTTIEEALRTVERMRRPSEFQQKSIKNIASNGDKESAVDETPEAPQATEDLFNDGSEETGNGSPEAARPKRNPGPKRDRNAGLELVGDLDFVPEGKPTLKSYFAEKAPSSDIDQVLVICYYLHHVLEVSTFGPGHILTGFKHVVKPVPVDLKQTIRNIKKEKAWLSFTDIENIRMTTEGDNRVEHELGKNGSNGESEG